MFLGYEDPDIFAVIDQAKTIYNYLYSKFLQNYNLRSKDIDVPLRPKSNKRAKNRLNQQFRGLKIDIFGTLIPLVIIFLFMLCWSLVRIIDLKSYAEDTSLLNLALSESVSAGFSAVTYYVTFYSEMISQGQINIFENIATLQEFSNSSYFVNFASTLDFQEQALLSNSTVAADLLNMFNQNVCPNPLNIQCPEAFENASIFKALYMMNNYVTELNNDRDNYLNNATSLYYAESFISVQTLAILLANQLELTADTILTNLTARFQDERNKIIAELIAILVLSIPLFVYLHFGFNRARKDDLQRAKHYLGYLPTDLIEKNFVVRTFLRVK